MKPMKKQFEIKLEIFLPQSSDHKLTRQISSITLSFETVNFPPYRPMKRKPSRKMQIKLKIQIIQRPPPTMNPLPLKMKMIMRQMTQALQPPHKSNKHALHNFFFPQKMFAFKLYLAEVCTLMHSLVSYRKQFLTVDNSQATHKYNIHT